MAQAATAMKRKNGIPRAGKLARIIRPGIAPTARIATYTREVPTTNPLTFAAVSRSLRSFSCHQRETGSPSSPVFDAGLLHVPPVALSRAGGWFLCGLRLHLPLVSVLELLTLLF
jgi:hypothetical protein